MLLSKRYFITKSRNFSKYIDKDKSGRAIRNKFLDYFINDKNHNFVKSSPVVPFCDPTVAFVNAGMNQFKGVFLGTQNAPYTKVVNSQKCIRVGGKHNDLNVVGEDGYHHTFFEMLGNWSFGDYYKRDACEMAWKLLTDGYGIPPSRLYVTYFKGDPNLGIEEDSETRDIWKSLGLPDDRILPFTSKDNFWEMGNTGPCGPCTEIHVDHLTTKNRADLVNKGLHDLTELWNLVFIQYNRKNKTMDVLPEKHVDTGMGFERLTAFLQGKISNYDTDNFTYLLKAIHKNCSKIPAYQGKFGESDWNRLDTSYRILSDHARMITVCLSDGVIPEQNQKLRRVLRRALLISETIFKKEGLLREISNYVIEHLGPIYPELERNAREIHQIIDYEDEVYKTLRELACDEWKKITKDHAGLALLDVNETPSFLPGLKEIREKNPKLIDAKLGFKLHDTFGLEEEAIQALSKALALEFDRAGFREELEKAKSRSKEAGSQNSLISRLLKSSKLAKTDRSNLYSYEKIGEKYNFGVLKVKILGIFEGDSQVSSIGPNVECSVVLDKSNFYVDAGGQIGDRGTMVVDGNIFEIIGTALIEDYVLHKGMLYASKTDKLSVGSLGTLYLDPKFRLNTMQNHTATHLLNTALKQIKGATCQKSSKVTNLFFNFDVGIFGDKISPNDIQTIQDQIKDLIQRGTPVEIKEIDSQELFTIQDVTMVPGEVYPEYGIRLIEVKAEGFLSREPCCGTHVLNISDLKDFVVVNIKSLGKGTASIAGVTGDRARIATANGIEILDNIFSFEKDLQDYLTQVDALKSSVNEFKRRLNHNIEDSNILPYLVKNQCAEVLNRITKSIKDSGSQNLRNIIESELEAALKSHSFVTKTGQKYLIHTLSNFEILEIPLHKITRYCPDIPVLILSYAEGTVKARCLVPKVCRTESFNAEKWLKHSFVEVLSSTVGTASGQDHTQVCNMRSKKINSQDWDCLLKESVKRAREYIERNL